jgi:HEAT repeat protein
VAIVVVAFWPGERQLEYNGKKLSEWLRAYELDSQRQAAADAIHHIGTNALPWLLKRIAYNPPGWKEKIAPYVAKTHSKILIHWYLAHIDDLRLAYEALDGFRLLGPKAVPAVPELARMIKDDIRRGAAKDWPMVALSYVGKDGFPPLLTALENPTKKYGAAECIVHMSGEGVDISPAMPKLLLMDRETKEQVIKSWPGGAVYHDSNFYSLPGLLDQNRPFLIPALTNCLHHTNSDVRVEAAKALGFLYSNARPAVPALKEALNDRVIAVQEAAAAALEKIPSEPPTNRLNGF